MGLHVAFWQFYFVLLNFNNSLKVFKSIHLEREFYMEYNGYVDFSPKVTILKITKNMQNEETQHPNDFLNH